MCEIAAYWFLSILNTTFRYAYQNLIPTVCDFSKCTMLYPLSVQEKCNHKKMSNYPVRMKQPFNINLKCEITGDSITSYLITSNLRILNFFVTFTQHSVVYYWLCVNSMKLSTFCSPKISRQQKTLSRQEQSHRSYHLCIIFIHVHENEAIYMNTFRSKRYFSQGYTVEATRNIISLTVCEPQCI